MLSGITTLKSRFIASSIKSMTVLLLVFLATACSPLTLVNAIGQDDGISQVESYAYGELPRQQCDVYFPKQPNGKLVFFIYGGSWMSGDKADYRFVARNLTRKGYTVVIADYRLYPEVRFPTFVEDAAQALAWTQGQLANWSMQPKSVFVVGHSAGAHIASLLALDERYLAPYGMKPTQLSGVVGLSTPADFAATLGAQYRPIFTDESGLQAAQPIRYVSSKAPPMLLIHGLDDGLVYASNTQSLASALHRVGAPVQVEFYEDVGHVGTVTPFIEWLGNQQVLNRMLAFMSASDSNKAIGWLGKVGDHP